MRECALFELLTSVADHPHRWRGEDEETFPKQRELPQHHYLLPEKLDELGHAAGWVGDLQGARKGTNKVILLSLSEQTCHHRQCECRAAFTPSFLGACSG